MAAISPMTKPHCHARSISLPSSSQEQSVFNEFCIVQASLEATTSCSSSSSAISHKLNQLNHLYESLQPLFTLPTTQQSLAQGCRKQQLNSLLDELLVLLDLCSTTKDALSTSIDSAKELQSVLRRKRGDNRGVISSVEEYLYNRRKAKKVVLKSLSSLQNQSSSSIKNNHIATSNIGILKEMESNTLTVFESLLIFILGSNANSKRKGWWSLVSKMVGYKRVQCEQKVEESEVKEVDDELHSIISYKKTKLGSLEVDRIQMGLAELEQHLLDLDEKIDCLCRHLIRARVSILNILIL